MPNALSSSTVLPRYATQPIAQAALPGDSISTAADAYPSLKAHIEEHLPRETTSWQFVVLGGLALLLHGAAVLGYIHRDQTSTLRPPRHEVEIELIRPVVVPPQEIEPPKPPPPKVVRRETPPPPAPAPTPALRTPPAEQDIAPDALTVPENTEAPTSPAPAVAVAPEPPPPPPPPAPKVEEPVTEATGYAAYLNNPPPEYPAFAQRQGWEGTVLLRVHVLASGKPDKVEIKQSSGRKTLDESALTAVRNWTFVPSKRGSTPIDGWATVPIEFKLAK